jgi:surface polysaccharide O-acyltransferase-like enzyme
MLAGLYLLTPWLFRLLHGASRTHLLLCLALAFVYCMLDPAGLRGAVGLCAYRLVPDYVFYLLLGCYAYRFRPALSRKTLAVLALTAVICLFALLLYGYPRYGQTFAMAAMSFFSPLVTLCALAVFLLALSVDRVRPALAMAAGLSLGIYLIHPLMLALLDRGGLNGFWLTPVAGISMTSLAAFSLAGGASWLLKQLPVFRRLV